MGKYWYWFGLKKYMTYIWSYTTSASKITWNVSSKIQCGSQVSPDFNSTQATLTQAIDSDSETASLINDTNPQTRSFWSLWPFLKLFFLKHLCYIRDDLTTPI